MLKSLEPLESREVRESVQSLESLAPPEPLQSSESLRSQASTDPSLVAGSAQTYHARVYATEADRYGVAGPLGGYWVTTAASCLLQPAVGDTVLVSMAGQDGYILAVLVQADPGHSDLCVPGNVRLSATRGTLTVTARDGLKLAGGSALMLDAKTASLNTQSLSIHAQTMQLAGDTQHSFWRNRHDVAHTHSSVATRMECRSQDRVTRISGNDELAAGSQRILVQGDWRVRARNADVRARKRASLDGKQVQLG